MAEAPPGPSDDSPFPIARLPRLECESGSDDENEENNPRVPQQYALDVEQAFHRITFFDPYTTILDQQHYKYPKWISGAGVNVCFDLLDKHFQADASRERPFNTLAFFNKVWKYEDNSVPTVNYFELLQRVRRFATSLGKKAAHSNDPHRVLILLPNCLEAIISILACFRLGYLFTVFCSRFEFPIEKRITDFKPTIIITVNGGFSKIPFLNFLSNIFSRTIGGCLQHLYVDYKNPTLPNQLIAQTDLLFSIHNFYGAVNDITVHIENDFNIYDINRPLYVAYTSGVTGPPKGCVHSARSIYASILSDDGFMCRTFENKEHVQPKTNPKERKLDTLHRPVTYCVSDLQHVVGLMGICVKPLFYRISSVLFEIMLDNVDPLDIFQVIEYLNVTNLYIPGNYLTDFFLKCPQGTKSNQPKSFKIAAFYTGEMHVASAVLRWAETLFGDLPIYQCFVVTELCGIITHHQNSPLIPKPETDLNRDNPLGYFIPFIRASLFKNGKEMQGTCWGQFFLKLPLPPMMMLYYWDKKPLTKRRFKVQKGYFALHDLINLDARGEVVWTSRSDATSLRRFDNGFVDRDGHLTAIILNTVFEYNHVTDCRLIVRMDPHGIQKAFIFYTSPIVDFDEITLMNKQVESVIHCLHGSQLDVSAMHLQRLPLTSDGTMVDEEQMQTFLNAQYIPDRFLNHHEFANFLAKTKDIRRSFNRKYIV